MFRSIDSSTSSWIQPKRASISNYRQHSLTIRSHIRNHIGLIFFWSLYLLVCLAISINVINIYLIQQQAHFLVVIARINGNNGDCTPFDVRLVHVRFSGGLLNFNCALILVLMLRKHITWLRSKGGSIILPLDHHIDIHKIIGIIILVETILHTVAHLAYIGVLVDY
jgi:hypothetical protein